MSILDITAALFRERRRVVIAVGFASAIAIVPVSAALSSEHSPSGSERSVAGCIPFTVICFPVSIESASAGWTRAVAVLPG